MDGSFLAVEEGIYTWLHPALTQPLATGLGPVPEVSLAPPLLAGGPSDGKELYPPIRGFSLIWDDSSVTSKLKTELLNKAKIPKLTH